MNFYIIKHEDENASCESKETIARVGVDIGEEGSNKEAIGVSVGASSDGDIGDGASDEGGGEISTEGIEDGVGTDDVGVGDIEHVGVVGEKKKSRL